MASSMVQSNKNMKRTQSRKSHSWWWDSHISPKNSKWLAENLEEMDRRIKQMLKLIEEDGDSFAKKADMYYQKRPELISHVEEFYRMYRSLAERYDHVTGELRKNIPSDIQSQGSCASDLTSEAPSAWPSPASDRRLSCRKSGPRAAGFEFFLGSGGSSYDFSQKEGDESSTFSDSEPESDDSSVNNYSVIFGNASERKIIELEIELRETKEKLQMQQDDNADYSFRSTRNENSEDLLARIARYEQELKITNEKMQVSEEEITRLRVELQKYTSSEFTNNLKDQIASSTEEVVKTREGELKFESNQTPHLQENGGLEAGTLDSNGKTHAAEQELRIMRERLGDAEKEIDSLKHQIESAEVSQKLKINDLQDQLSLAYRDSNTWKAKLNAEKREVSKLQERIARLKTSLSDRDHEIRDLKIAVSDAEQKIFPEKAQIKAEISRLLEERTCFEEQLRELESNGRTLEDEIRKCQAEKIEVTERLNFEIEQLKADIVERDIHIQKLDKGLDDLKSERNELKGKILTLKGEVIYRDDQIDQMDKHLQQLHLEHVGLISGAEEAKKLVDEWRSRSVALEEEVEKQKILIEEGAEEKREAIRQLCFSLEHYRLGYHRLRQAYMGHKRVPVLAV